MGHLQHDEWGRQHGDRSSKDVVVNEEGRKLIEFCERNSLEMLNGKCGEEGRELTFINLLGRSVIDCALVPLEKLVNFRVDVLIISSHIPVTVEMASGIEVIRRNTMVYIGANQENCQIQ
jgi:hypothetical protein